MQNVHKNGDCEILFLQTAHRVEVDSYRKNMWHGSTLSMEIEGIESKRQLGELALKKYCLEKVEN